MDVRPPMATGLDLVLFRYDVSVADLLHAVETEVGLLVEHRGPVGVGGDVDMLQCESLVGRF